ncbi:MAG: hypothetical protein A2X28_01715 [Elusimicrobia bacterium GWA2_56_46]|nr:MAG: hypothetical protein A2X28_01715 [Elusimicrobia bacterium GWA2_56_46]OGR53873.1 MAG: hypothetical protein A2X39_07115 [Elusimicrobia bacterium GWC2_56_31]HBW22727.1 hypothetical protein [Elusimicrobiota bacterium]
MSVKILKGSILVHRVFDVGGEILLAQAEKHLSEDSKSLRLKLATDTRKAIIIKDAPLKVELGETQLNLNGADFSVKVFARIWNYGVISITLELPVPEGIPWASLVKLAGGIEASEEIDKAAAAAKNGLKKKILPAVKSPAEWDAYEDYITYFIEKLDGVDNPRELLEKADVSSLILAESRESLSETSKDLITENVLQYSENDLAVIDWNSALLIEPDGQRDVADVIEFSLTHLLEFRYYDDLLNLKLDELYDTIDQKKEGVVNIFKNFYADIAEDSSTRYIEFSEFLGRIENSLKTVGDPYLATVFRSCSEQFRFDDWRKSISRKMETLADITQLLQGEVNSKRSHWLEIIIIVLIAVELVPMFRQFLTYLNSSALFKIFAKLN